MVYLTGDCHGQMSITKLSFSNWPHGKTLCKNDYVINLGDFGIIWKDCPDKEELYWKDWLDDKPWTTLVVPGNHENYTRIDAIPDIDFLDGKVKKYSDSIYLLNRGEIYNICGEKFFVMGGAESVDKNNRVPYVSWWDREMPSTVEYEHGLQNLEDHNWEVDYILGHTCPHIVNRYYIEHFSDKRKELLKYIEIDDTINLKPEDLKVLNYVDDWNKDGGDSLSMYFDEVVKRTKFKQFYFGHFHSEWTSKKGKYVMLYNNIVALGNDHNDVPINI